LYSHGRTIRTGAENLGVNKKFNTIPNYISWAWQSALPLSSIAWKNQDFPKVQFGEEGKKIYLEKKRINFDYGFFNYYGIF
jgi:hypothetical protein